MIEVKKVEKIASRRKSLSTASGFGIALCLLFLFVIPTDTGHYARSAPTRKVITVEYDEMEEELADERFIPIMEDEEEISKKEEDWEDVNEALKNTTENEQFSQRVKRGMVSPSRGVRQLDSEEDSVSNSYPFSRELYKS
jgi:hypothetical protein